MLNIFWTIDTNPFFRYGDGGHLISKNVDSFPHKKNNRMSAGKIAKQNLLCKCILLGQNNNIPN